MELKRITGLLVIETRSSNPNGDPDRESDPRQRVDGRGEISPVSVKRKIRDLIEDKQGPVWTELSKEMNLIPEQYDILEARGRERKKIEDQLKVDFESFKSQYWDGRLFGNTFLEKGGADTIRTGVVQFGLGTSIAPINVTRHTFTNKSGVQEGKDRGMAPLSYRVVEHAVYTVPFFINPSAAHKSGCTQKDIDLMLRVLPYIYTHTASLIRSSVILKHIHTFTHNNALGTLSDFVLIDALTPRKKENPEEASSTIEDYDIPHWSSIEEKFAKKGSYRDCMLS